MRLAAITVATAIMATAITVAAIAIIGIATHPVTGMVLRMRSLTPEERAIVINELPIVEIYSIIADLLPEMMVVGGILTAIMIIISIVIYRVTR